MASLTRAALLLSLCFWAIGGFAADVSRRVLGNGDINIQDITMSPPEGWTLYQDAIADGTLLLAFSKGTQNFNLYVKKQVGLDMRGIFVNGSQVLKAEAPETHGPFQWTTLSTSKTTTLASGTSNYFVSAYLTEHLGYSFYGYARAESADAATANAHAFLDGIRVQVGRSLTGPDYTGKKYYFGFGDLLDGEMGNEVKYDINHTHDIFTKSLGGDYLGYTQLSPGHSGITSEWDKLKGQIGPSDMYLEYSSGHGSETGLMVGVDYSEIRDFALSLPAKEIVIFTMSCFSGNLVDSFNEQKSTWQNWQSQGRTLFVMASSRDDQESSTGPGTDVDEPGGPDGSAGSAFGYSLWKALIGYADGYVDGVKDGFISLGEIQGYVTQKSQEVGQQNPVVTGAYNAALIMDKVPSKPQLEALLKGSSENLSDAQVMQLIRKLDEEMRVK